MVEHRLYYITHKLHLKIGCQFTKIKSNEAYSKFVIKNAIKKKKSAIKNGRNPHGNY
jgi:hypothetical protein